MDGIGALWFDSLLQLSLSGHIRRDASRLLSKTIPTNPIPINRINYKRFAYQNY